MEKLQYKIKNGPRVESTNQFKMGDDTIVAIFQGFRGENPDLDFIVKYKEPDKRLRTPSHTHWIVDLIVKGEVYPTETLSLVKDLINIYDSVNPFTSKEERDSYELTYSLDLVEKYSTLNNTGSLSIELIGTLVELFSKCEKQTSGAFMLKYVDSHTRLF